MRATAAVLLLLAIPLTGSVLSPSSPEGAPEGMALAASANAAQTPAGPLAASTQPPCAVELQARASSDHVALSWTDCPGVAEYQVLRGPSAAELVPIVTVNHASHIDLFAGSAVYAVRAGDGPLSDAVVISRS